MTRNPPAGRHRPQATLRAIHISVADETDTLLQVTLQPHLFMPLQLVHNMHGRIREPEAGGASEGLV